ncbi:uncharacterized protein ACOB8E_010158 [Sarcophilus harrisii]
MGHGRTGRGSVSGPARGRARADSRPPGVCLARAARFPPPPSSRLLGRGPGRDGSTPPPQYPLAPLFPRGSVDRRASVGLVVSRRLLGARRAGKKVGKKKESFLCPPSTPARIPELPRPGGGPEGCWRPSCAARSRSGSTAGGGRAARGGRSPGLQGLRCAGEGEHGSLPRQTPAPTSRSSQGQGGGGRKGSPPDTKINNCKQGVQKSHLASKQGGLLGADSGFGRIGEGCPPRGQCPTRGSAMGAGHLGEVKDGIPAGGSRCLARAPGGWGGRRKGADRGTVIAGHRSGETLCLCVAELGQSCGGWARGEAAVSTQVQTPGGKGCRGFSRPCQARRTSPGWPQTEEQPSLYQEAGHAERLSLHRPKRGSHNSLHCH